MASFYSTSRFTPLIQLPGRIHLHRAAPWQLQLTAVFAKASSFIPDSLLFQLRGPEVDLCVVAGVVYSLVSSSSLFVVACHHLCRVSSDAEKEYEWFDQ